MSDPTSKKRVVDNVKKRLAEVASAIGDGAAFVAASFIAVTLGVLYLLIAGAGVWVPLLIAACCIKYLFF